MSDLSQRTVTFLVKQNRVLLGFKKTGFGKGNYLGIGGKLEEGETLEEAATREVEEEIKVELENITKVGDFTFLFPDKPTWSQQVHAYIAKTWSGDSQETDEIRPEWLSFNDLPLSQMWDDAQFWLPAILNGHSLKGTFTFNNDLKVTALNLKEASFNQ